MTNATKCGSLREEKSCAMGFRDIALLREDVT